VLNDNPWETQVEVQWNVVPGTIRASFVSGGIQPNPDAFTSYFLTIPPNEVAWLEWDNTNAVPVTWSSSEEQSFNQWITALQSVETTVNQFSVPVLNRDILTNPGFEPQPDMDRDGSVVGWVTSLNPKAIVRIGVEQPQAGDQYLEVSCDKSGASAWLQSQPFELQTNRFQVGLHQRINAPSPVSLQWSLSTWNSGEERYVLVARRNLVVDPNKQPSGQWAKWSEDFSEEISALGPVQSRTYRLQLDIQASSRVDIDSVIVSTDYLQDRERIEIRNALFLARRSLSEGQSDPAFRLLDSPTIKTLLQWSIENTRIPGALDPLEPTDRLKPPSPRSTVPISKKPGPESRSSDRRWRLWNR
jgi:hypothetical protein